MNSEYTRAAAIAFALTASAPSTFGEILLYYDEDREEWFENAGAITTLDFTGFANNETITDQYSEFGVTFEGTNFVTGPSGSFPDSWGLRIFFGNEITFEEPIQSFGGTYLGTYQVDLYLAESLLGTAGLFFEPGLGADFGGFISDQPFDRIVVYDPSDELTVFDDMFFGPPANVPEPGALMAIGLGLLARRRRSRLAS